MNMRDKSKGLDENAGVGGSPTLLLGRLGVRWGWKECATVNKFSIMDGYQ